MKDDLTDIFIVIGYSGRTQAAIILGMVGFIVINLTGEYYLTDFQLSGQFSSLTEVIKNKLAHKYDKAAWGVLIGFWWTAFKLYQKDKKKFWSQF